MLYSKSNSVSFDVRWSPLETSVTYSKQIILLFFIFSVCFLVNCTKVFLTIHGSFDFLAEKRPLTSFYVFFVIILFVINYCFFDMLRNEFDFILTIIGIRNLINVSTLGKRDTFIWIEYEGKKYRLSTIHNTGNCPSMINSSMMKCSMEC